jgi:hypothetical protein
VNVLHQRILFIVGYVATGGVIAYTVRHSRAYRIAVERATEQTGALSDEQFAFVHRVVFVFNAGMWPFLLLWQIALHPLGFVRRIVRYAGEAWRMTEGDDTLIRHTEDRVRFFLVMWPLMLAFDHPWILLLASRRTRRRAAIARERGYLRPLDVARAIYVSGERRRDRPSLSFRLSWWLALTRYRLRVRVLGFYPCFHCGNPIETNFPPPYDDRGFFCLRDRCGEAFCERIDP